MYKVIPFICTEVNNHLNSCYSKFSPSMEVGEANGYIAIDKSHPLYGKHYDVVNKYLSAPGGFTYSEMLTHEFMSLCEKIGEVFKGELTDLPEDLWILGWDSCHYGMNRTNFSRKVCISKTLNIANELANFGKILDKKDK